MHKLQGTSLAARGRRLRHCFLSGGLETCNRIVGRRECPTMLFLDAATKGENAVASRELGKPLRVNPCSTQNEVYTDLPHKETPNGNFLRLPHSKMKQIVSTPSASDPADESQPIASPRFFLFFTLIPLFSPTFQSDRPRLRATAVRLPRRGLRIASRARVPESDASAFHHCSETPIN